MRTLLRSARSIIRNPLHGGLLAVLLIVSICLTLVMITVDGAFGKQLDQVKNQVGTAVTVAPARTFFGFGGSNSGNSGTSNSSSNSDTTATLTNDDANAFTKIAHVTAVTGTISTATIDTTLKPPTSTSQFPGAAGRFSNSNTGNGVFIPTTGTSDPNYLSSGQSTTSAKLTKGRTFTNSELNANVAIISQGLAKANSLSLGSAFQISGQKLTIIGITESSQFGGFGDIFLPLTTAQRILKKSGQLNQIILQVDDMSNVQQVATQVTNQLNNSQFSVTTSQDRYDQIAGSIESARDSSRIGLIVAVIASALIILFGVIMGMRQRIREIGILKAIGAANWQVVAQFGVETLLVSVSAAIVGALITFPIAQRVANSLVSSGGGSGFPGSGGRGGGASLPNGSGGGGAFRPPAVASQGVARAGGFLGSIHVAVSPTIFLYALGFAVILALIACAMPVWRVSRVRPAEVLRYE